jgi:hypothetical protein
MKEGIGVRTTTKLSKSFKGFQGITTIEEKRYKTNEEKIILNILRINKEVAARIKG